MSNKKARNRRDVRIPKEVEDFTKFTFKQFRKRTKGDYKNKDKQLNAYFDTMADGMQYVVEFFVRYGHIKDENIEEAKNRVFMFLKDETFCKRMLKMFEKDRLNVKDYIYLPVLIRDVLEEEAKAARQMKVENPDAPIPSHENLVKLSMFILKKKIKKMVKAGINADLAFDILSIIPTEKILKFSANYRIRMVYFVLYEHAKNKEIPFGKIVKKVFGDTYRLMVINYALLEKKERFADLTDQQKAFYTTVTSWCIETMENELRRDDVDAILKYYIAQRKRDEAAGRDGTRRYPLSTLSEVDYPNVYKAINSFIARNENDKKYL